MPSGFMVPLETRVANQVVVDQENKCSKQVDFEFTPECLADFDYSVPKDSNKLTETTNPCDFLSCMPPSDFVKDNLVFVGSKLLQPIDKQNELLMTKEIE